MIVELFQVSILELITWLGFGSFEFFVFIQIDIWDILVRLIAWVVNDVVIALMHIFILILRYCIMSVYYFMRDIWLWDIYAYILLWIQIYITIRSLYILRSQTTSSKILLNLEWQLAEYILSEKGWIIFELIELDELN